MYWYFYLRKQCGSFNSQWDFNYQYTLSVHHLFEDVYDIHKDQKLDQNLDWIQRFSYARLSLVESAGAVGFPSSVQCSRCAGLCVRPAGGDRAFGATCELSADSSHWAHKSFPAEKETQRKCQPLCRSAVASHKMARLNNTHVHVLELYGPHCNSGAGFTLTLC